MGKPRSEIPTRPGQPDEELVTIRDRIGIAIRTLKAAGVPVDPTVVLAGAGLEIHSQRRELRGGSAG